MYDSTVENGTAYVIVPTWSIILKYCMYACIKSSIYYELLHVWYGLLFVTVFDECLWVIICFPVA